MVCKQCGRELEFDSPAVARLVDEVERGCGFKVTNARIDLEGYCSECAAKQEEATEG
jgi:Fe2+ or Zn2+ uptake regulation protein